MELVVDETHLGTPESEWQASRRLRQLPPLALPRPGRVVVVSPHPDDEIFGAGGLIAQMQSSGIPVEIIAVSDGEASHPAGRPPASICDRYGRTNPPSPLSAWVGPHRWSGG